MFIFDLIWPERIFPNVCSLPYKLCGRLQSSFLMASRLSSNDSLIRARFEESNILSTDSCIRAVALRSSSRVTVVLVGLQLSNALSRFGWQIGGHPFTILFHSLQDTACSPMKAHCSPILHLYNLAFLVYTNKLKLPDHQWGRVPSKIKKIFKKKKTLWTKSNIVYL